MQGRHGGPAAAVAWACVETNGPASAGSTGTKENPPAGARLAAARSEEHTSELQSLMRLSYAGFCLKKKKTKKKKRDQKRKINIKIRLRENKRSKLDEKCQ